MIPGIIAYKTISGKVIESSIDVSYGLSQVIESSIDVSYQIQ